MATRWGIASAGKICHDFCTAVKTLFPEEHELVAVAARSLESAQKFAATHKIPKTYSSYEDLGRDPSIQVVYVGSINTTHYAIVKSLLELGKNVLVEKPMTLNQRQTRELVDLARSKKLFLMEAIWSRFLPAYQYALKEIRGGAIGQVLHAHVPFGVPIENVERVARREMGGGTILDLGVYTINGVLFLGFPDEDPESISAVGVLNENGVDLSMSAVLKFSGKSKSGKAGTASITTDARGLYRNELTIVGTSGTLVVNSPFWCADSVTVNGTRREFKFPVGIHEFNFDNSCGLAYEAREVRKCLLAGKLESDILPLAESIRIAGIQDELRRQIGVVYPEDSEQ